MSQPTSSAAHPGAALKRLASRLLTIGENRLELLLVEAQEERERFFQGMALALGVALFGFLSGVALSCVILVLLWEISPIAALLSLSCLYGLTAAYLYHRLARLLSDWKSFSATLGQLKKDRACLEETLN